VSADEHNGMTEIPAKPTREEVEAWIKKRTDEVVLELMLDDVYVDRMVEAKPVWAAPCQILIGKIRELGEPNRFRWFICGEVPTDHLDAASASTPREAARHFAMKLQLDAARLCEARQQNATGPAPQVDYAGELAARAEGLFALVNDETIWQKTSGF